VARQSATRLPPLSMSLFFVCALIWCQCAAGLLTNGHAAIASSAPADAQHTSLARFLARSRHDRPRGQLKKQNKKVRHHGAAEHATFLPFLGWRWRKQEQGTKKTEYF